MLLISQLKYYILLIITDGIINDFQATVDEIVRGTSLPLSILIVGVGEEDFKEMDELDADEKPLYSNKLKKFMERDIVQFVPYLQFKNNPNELARQTLEEIPGQLTSFMESKKITPTQFINQGRNSMKADADFYGIRKKKFTEQAIAMGYQQASIDQLMSKGLPEESFDMFTMHINNCYYTNPLK